MIVKRAKPQRRIRSCFCGALLFVFLLVAHSTQGELPKPSSTDQPSQPAADPLGRTTPRGTMVGFLSAANGQKYDIAAQYLDTRATGKNAAYLAKQLSFVLDRRLPAKLNNISNDPLGSQSDPLDARRELIGSIATASGSIDIYLQRADRPKGAQVWLFSRQTLADIPDLYDKISVESVEQYLPDFLLRRYFGITLFSWLFFFVFLPLLYVVLSMISSIVGAAAGFVLRHWAGRPAARNPRILPHPVRLLILSLTVFATVSQVSLSLLARQIASTIGVMLLISAFVWAMFLISARCEGYVKKRMESRGRLSSTAVLRPARRVVDLIAAVLGLIFVLHALGINASAALAGLGVGGIAVALAAQKTLENVIGGISLILDGAVRVGDCFKIGDVVGTIEVIGLRSTRVRTSDRTMVMIPNGQMANMTLENFSARDRFWLRHVIGIGSHTASAQLNAVLLEVRHLLESDIRVLPSTSRVRFLRLAQFSLELEVVAYISARDWDAFLEAQEQLLIRIREVIQSCGVEVAYPTQEIYVKKDTKLMDEASVEPLQNVPVVGEENIHA